MIKKFFCFLLVFVFAFGSISVFASDSDEATDIIDERINSILQEFPIGSYFTANGKGCGHLEYQVCDNCLLSNILAAHGIEFIENYHYDGWTCYAFASYVFTTVFEEIPANAILVARSEEEVYNENGQDTFYDAMKLAKKGDYLVFLNQERRYHFAIFISCDENGVTVLQNNVHNGDYVGTIAYEYVRYGSLNGYHKKYDTVLVYSSHNYPGLENETNTETEAEKTDETTVINDDNKDKIIITYKYIFRYQQKKDGLLFPSHPDEICGKIVKYKSVKSLKFLSETIDKKLIM